MMASKYDAFWAGKAAELHTAVEQAAAGQPVALPMPDIRGLGERGSWTGTAVVNGRTVMRASMAHMVALARAAAGSGWCAAWPYQEFIFAMSPSATLRVRAQSRGSIATPARTPMAPLASPRPAPMSNISANEEMVDAAQACALIHQVLRGLPQYRSPDEVPFANGLYFFFDAGERSAH